jgi:SAM-dependent methyltransferase
MERSDDPNAFSAFERAGWNAVSGGYVDVFGPLTAQTIDPTLDAARVGRGTRVLDVCTGHGVLAHAALSRHAQVDALDFAEEMVALTRRKLPDAQVRQGDAQDLPYPDCSFDAVICGYGIMHLADPARALAEMFRITRPSGRVAASVWARAVPDNGLGLLYQAIRTHGRTDVPLPHGPDFFQFGTKESMHAAFAATGFTDIEVVAVAQHWRFKLASQLVEAILRGAVRARALLNAQEPAAMRSIRSAVEQGVMHMFSDGDGYSVPMPAIVGAGTRP